MARVDPALAATRTSVRAELAGLARGDLVLVACSGGADSLALAAAAAREARRVGRSVRSKGYAVRAGAVVVDHGLQEGSADVAARAAGQCRDLGLDPVVVRRVEVDAGAAVGLEAAARTARYAALDAVADEAGAAAVLLGHTLDDQAESVLLGLARGSGGRSLAGMPRRRGRYRRPFLGLRRAQTEAACAALGLTYWTDPTNVATVDQGDDRSTPLRSRVRAAAVPVLQEVLGPGVVEALARTADQLRDDADLLDALAADLLAAARVPDDEEAVADAPEPALVLDAAALADAPAALRRRALRAAALAAGCPPAATTARHVDALDALVVSWRGQGPAHLPGDARAWRTCGRLFLAPATAGRDAVSSASATPRSNQVDQSDVAGDLASILLTEEQLASKLDEIATQIDADYAGKDLLLVGVLKGAVMVMADLARRLHHPVQMDWMAVSSYGSGTKSSGVVRILKDLDSDLTGRNVLIVEDIIDSGLTLTWLVSNLRSRGPASVEIATMLRKPDAAKVDVDVKYVGFDIPNEFVVGYGLDYAERFRNLPFVATLAPHVYS